MEFIFNGVIGTLVQQCGHDRPKPPIFLLNDQFVLDYTVIGKAVKGSEFSPKRFSGRGGIETQLFADGVANGVQHFGRRAVGIFVGVQFDERRLLRLFARRVRRQETDVWSNQGGARGHGNAVWFYWRIDGLIKAD